MRQLVVDKSTIAFAVLVGLALLVTPALPAEPGLLIVAHGAPLKQWNAGVLEFGEKVAKEATSGGRFKAVRTAFLEFAQPDVPAAIAELEAEGCDRIIAVPLFIAPSGHSHFDVPAVLGIYSSPKIKTLIAAEGGRIAEPRVPVTLTQTLHDGEVLCAFALDQVRQHSRNPQEEALVLIAHGDAGHQQLVDRMMRRTITYCCGQAGIDYGDWAFVGMGQGYMEHGYPAVTRALEHKKRVIVVGLYVASSARSIHRRAVALARRGNKDYADPYQGKPVALSEQGIIAHPDTVRWVLDAATSALVSRPEAASNSPLQNPSDANPRSVGPPSPTFRRHGTGFAGLGGPALQFCTGLLCRGHRVHFQLKKQISPADRGMCRQNGHWCQLAAGAVAAERRSILRLLEIGDSPDDVRPIHAARLQDRVDNIHAQRDLRIHIAGMNRVSLRSDAGSAGNE